MLFINVYMASYTINSSSAILFLFVLFDLLVLVIVLRDPPRYDEEEFLVSSPVPYHASHRCQANNTTYTVL